MRPPKAAVSATKEKQLDAFIDGNQGPKEERIMMNWRPTITEADRIRSFIANRSIIKSGKNTGPTVQSMMTEAVKDYLDKHGG